MKEPRETTPEAVDLILSRFSNLIKSDTGSGRICLVYGTGGQPRLLYKQIQAWNGVHLMSAISTLPWYLAWLGFIPSHAGIIEIINSAKLNPVFEAVSASSMAGVFWISKKSAENVAELFAARAGLEVLLSKVLEDSGSISYILNANDNCSETDLSDWLYFGNEVEESIQSEFTEIKIHGTGGKKTLG